MHDISKMKKKFILTPKRIYVAMTLPAIVAKPPTITACNSDVVMSLIMGLINSGASVYNNTQTSVAHKFTVNICPFH